MTDELIRGFNGHMYVKPSVEQMVDRLLVAVAWLATNNVSLGVAAEYAIEAILYPEQFPSDTLEKLDALFAGVDRVVVEPA